MAIVTGMTAEKINEIVDDAVISASVDEATGVLTLQTRGGQTLTADNIGSTDVAVDRAYPVGSIFMSTIATNPAEQLGIGTWQAWGTGRVPVAVDPAQTEFDTIEKTGGAKTHTLSVNEMPGHTHTGPSHTHDMSHDHPSASTDTTGAHEHGARANDADGTTKTSGVYRTGTTTGFVSDDGGAMILSGGEHFHHFDVPYFPGATGPAGTGATGAAGGNAAHNNLQPYITCYMWKRTA